MMTKFYFFALLTLVVVNCRRSLPEYEINLDLPVSERYAELLRDFKEPASLAFGQVLNKFKMLLPALRALAHKRGPETPEMQEELEYFSSAIDVPLIDLQIINWLAEIGSIMIPTHIRKQMGVWEEAFELIGYPMCTGILAYAPDGTVNHARNQDFLLPEFLSRCLFTGRFTRGGVLLFRAQMYSGFSGVITAFKEGVMSLEVNTRYPEVMSGNIETLMNLFVKKTPLGMWMVRKTFEELTSYEQGVQTLSTMQITGPIYFIVSGVRQGTILARDPSTLVHQITLGVDHPKYIVMTNFDYWNNDWREYFDPTAHFYRRRIGVMKALEGLQDITQEVLYETINREDVIATDTLYQVVMNVETGYFNSSTPYDL